MLKHGLRNVFIRNVHKINKGAPRLVGAFEQTVFEDFVEERVRAGEGIYRLYPPEAEAEQAFREWRREKGR